MTARQSRPFDPDKAARLDDPEREKWLPTDGLIQLAAIPPLGCVLDYGTGTGRYALAIARQRIDATIFAFDSQERMLEIARARAVDAGLRNLIIAGPSRDSLPAATFDRVLGINVLHELDENDLTGLRPLLARGGSALFVDWDAAIDRPVGPPAAHTYNEEEACVWLMGCGFRAHVIEQTLFPYHFAVWASED